MSQNFDTTIGLSADFSSAGQPFDFDGAFVTNLVITNNSGVGIQYTADGSNWSTINPAGSASPTVPDSTTFYLRKMAAGGAPASVRLTWRAGDSLGVSSIYPTSIGGIVRLGDVSRAVAALAAASAGAPTTHVRLGDSTTVGLGAGVGTTWTGAAQRNVSSLLAAQSSGLISNDSFMGDAGAGGSPGYSVYNPNVTLGNGWSANTSTLGGLLFKFTVGGTGALRMALPAGTQKVRIYYVGGASATVQTDVGSVGSIAAVGLALLSADFTVQSGATYIEVAAPSTTFFVVGMAAINTTQKVLLLNAGINGAKVADFTAAVNVYDSLATLKSIAPSLTEINLTINDALAPTAKATYQASLVTLVEGALVGGSVVLKVGAISNAVSSTNGSLFDIQSVVMDVAGAYNLTVLSTPAALGGGFTQANANGFMFDANHPTFAGYGAEATKCQLQLLSTMRAIRALS